MSPPRTSTSIVCTILYVVFLSFAFRKLDFDLQYSLSRTILVKLKLTYYRCKSRAQYMDSQFSYTQEDASKVSCQSKCIWTAKHIQIYIEMLRVLFCLLFRLLFCCCCYPQIYCNWHTLNSIQSLKLFKSTL